MERKASRIIIETLVRKALRDIKDSPERSMRNLVDMALHFSQGRFQQRFFTAAQTMLQNEQSAYYDLVQDLVSHVASEKILRFGMNVGYNSCTMGANTIRILEEQKQCNIPWCISLEIDNDIYFEHSSRYHDILSQGEAIGIFTWMLFTEKITTELLALCQRHPHSAFVLFPLTVELSSDCLDTLSELDNAMLIVPYEEEKNEIYLELRRRELLYSVSVSYNENDIPAILSGELFQQTQQVHPSFTVLIPTEDCSETARQQVYDTVLSIRSEQTYPTIPWEFVRDTLYIDSVISQDSCLAVFDRGGRLRSEFSGEASHYDLFDMDLMSIFQSVFPKTT